MQETAYALSSSTSKGAAFKHMLRKNPTIILAAMKILTVGAVICKITPRSIPMREVELDAIISCSRKAHPRIQKTKSCVDQLDLMHKGQRGEPGNQNWHVQVNS
jgi:hypothetical protein